MISNKIAIGNPRWRGLVVRLKTILSLFIVREKGMRHCATNFRSDYCECSEVMTKDYDLIGMNLKICVVT